MLSFLFKSGSSFEVALNDYLSLSDDRLCEGKLHNVMSALRGQDPNIKSEIAFATLKKLVTSFEPDSNQLRMLKELIVLDQLVEEGLFCAEISLISFFAVEGKAGGEAWRENLQRVLRLFWKVIKDKSIIMVQSEHIFHEKRSQRINYLAKMKPGVLLNQIGTIQGFFGCIFELVYYLQHPSYSEEEAVTLWRKSGATDHVILHLLFKLLYLYNCQMMIHRHLATIAEQLSPQQLLRLKRAIMKFRDHCNRLIIFIKQHRKVKGFQSTTYEDIRVEVNQILIKFVDNYLQYLEKEANQPYLNKLPLNLEKMIVEKKPMTEIGKFHCTPRLTCPQPSKKQQGTHQSNTFLNWQNSYSHEFPQKEIMTVDLIMQIKLQETLHRQFDDQQVDERRDDNVYLRYCGDTRSTCASSVYSVNFVKIKEYAVPVLQGIHFENIYSKMSVKWNQ